MVKFILFRLTPVVAVIVFLVTVDQYRNQAATRHTQIEQPAHTVR